MPTPFASASAKPALPTQVQHFYAADRHVSTVNEDFLWLVNNGLTKEDLTRNIERRPSLWQRFEGFVHKLPSRAEAPLAAH